MKSGSQRETYTKRWWGNNNNKNVEFNRARSVTELCTLHWDIVYVQLCSLVQYRKPLWCMCGEAKEKSLIYTRVTLWTIRKGWRRRTFDITDWYKLLSLNKSKLMMGWMSYMRRIMMKIYIYISKGLLTHIFKMELKKKNTHVLYVKIRLINTDTRHRCPCKDILTFLLWQQLGLY